MYNNISPWTSTVDPSFDLNEIHSRAEEATIKGLSGTKLLFGKIIHYL